MSASGWLARGTRRPSAGRCHSPSSVPAGWPPALRQAGSIGRPPAAGSQPPARRRHQRGPLGGTCRPGVSAGRSRPDRRRRRARIVAIRVDSCTPRFRPGTAPSVAPRPLLGGLIQVQGLTSPDVLRRDVGRLPPRTPALLRAPWNGTPHPDTQADCPATRRAICPRVRRHDLPGYRRRGGRDAAALYLSAMSASVPVKVSAAFWTARGVPNPGRSRGAQWPLASLLAYHRPPTASAIVPTVATPCRPRGLRYNAEIPSRIPDH